MYALCVVWRCEHAWFCAEVFNILLKINLYLYTYFFPCQHSLFIPQAHTGYSPETFQSDDFILVVLDKI